jgi:tetratricopeptide (TPR) repeat protein
VPLPFAPRRAGTGAALLAAALAAVLLAAATPTHAAAQAGEPKRPSLKAPADTNSWQAYYQHGISLLGKRPDRAVEAFHWAARLDPSRPEPLYAQWAATWMSRPEQFGEYYDGAKYFVNSDAVRRVDSLYYQALLRNPFLHQGLERAMVAALHNRKFGPGNWQWRDKPEDLAWLAYSELRFDEAARHFERALAAKPKRTAPLHLGRAGALALAKQYDGAVVELRQLIDEQRGSEQAALVYFYQSKAMFEYSVGVAHTLEGDHAAAREAYGRALAEDLSFYRAHAALAAAALSQGDTATALTEFDLAVQLDGSDAALRTDYGLILIQAGRPADAATQLATAVAANPHYALPHFYLAHALDAQGQHAQAVPHYTAFVARAPADLQSQAEHARKRVAQLAAAPAAAPAGAP